MQLIQSIVLYVSVLGLVLLGALLFVLCVAPRALAAFERLKGAVGVLGLSVFACLSVVTTILAQKPGGRSGASASDSARTWRSD